MDEPALLYISASKTVANKYYNVLKIEAENDYVDYDECSLIRLDFDKHNVCMMKI
jgi:hypothetical protein